MTLIRCDDTYSSKYALMEDTLIKIGQGQNQGCLTETIYKLDPMKKNLIDNFMQAREQMLLLSKGNIGRDGKPTLSDRQTGRPIPIGWINSCQYKTSLIAGISYLATIGQSAANTNVSKVQRLSKRNY